MDINDDLICFCGKVFLRASAAANHRRSCSKAKRKISAVLGRAKSTWEERQLKRQKRDPGPAPQIASGSISATLHPTPQTPQRESNPGHHRNHDLAGGSPTQFYEDGPNEVSEDPSQLPSPGPDALAQAEADENLDLPIAQRRSRRRIQRPGRLKDYLPHPPSPIPIDSSSITGSTVSEDNILDISAPTHTAANTIMASSAPTIPQMPISSTANRFKVFRRYILPQAPSHSTQISEDTSNILPSSTSSTHSTTEELIAPYPNMSSFLLGEWYWNHGTQKSKRDFESLTKILRNPNFDINAIQRTSWEYVDRKLGESKLPSIGESTGEISDGWICSEVSIEVPFHSRMGREVVPGPKTFLAGDFHYRSIISIIKEKLSGPNHRLFHMDPHELFWQPPNQPAQRIYGELYTSVAFLREHEKLQQSPPEPGCQRPRVIVGLMFSSDETHLTQFGETKLWPLYMYFGNESKYRRCKPSEHLCEHIAYFTKLPDVIKEFMTSHTKTKGFSPSLIAHCIRELLHAQWEIILDDDFVHAYEHGIVILCFDGIERRFYPRIFTYSADYKEKQWVIPLVFVRRFLTKENRTILAGIRNLGLCPCPRCLIPMKEIENLGTAQDRRWRDEHIRSDNKEYQRVVAKARKNLYQKNYALDGDYVDGILKEQSLTPVKTAFSSRLSRLGLDFFTIFVVDQMHEIESGNWKSLFIHLLRILNCCDPKTLIHQVDLRYRQIPTFGRDTIRKFRKNVTDMRNLAARDWEDMLQCAIPVFEGLLDEPHNTIVLDLLFSLAHWHGLAKLRMHTDTSLALLDRLTTDLGNNFHRFKDVTCKAFKTRELPREVNARVKRTQSASRKRARPGQAESEPAPLLTHSAPVPLSSAQTGSEPAPVLTHPAPGPPASNRTSGRKRAQKSQTGAKSTPVLTHSTSVPRAAVRNYKQKQSQTEAETALVPPVSGQTSRQQRTITSPIESETVPVLTLSEPVPPVSDQTSNHGITTTNSRVRQPKLFNMNTYKFHAFGDYVSTIRLFGTTDSYSTESGELEHRNVKARYKRTSKKNYVKQLTQIERRQARIHKIRHTLDNSHNPQNMDRETTTVIGPADAENEPEPDPGRPYVIGQSQNDAVFIHDFLHKSASDPATKNFLPKLKEHLLMRIHTRMSTVDESRSITFQHDRMYRHRVMRINYTTYDIRRDEDVVNPNTTHCDIMMVRDDADGTPREGEGYHPFLYARILGIFHVNVILVGSGKDSDGKRMDVLWVQWYKHLPPKGPHRPHRLRFLPPGNDDAFGFVDPRDVLRSCHVAPALADGKKTIAGSVSEWRGRDRVTFYNIEQITLTEQRSLKTAGVSKLGQEESQWNTYYVNPFVDRDMLMRFHWGMAVGHLYCTTSLSGAYSFDTAYEDLDSHSIDAATVNTCDHGTQDQQDEHEGPANAAHYSSENVSVVTGTWHGDDDNTGTRPHSDESAVTLIDGTFELQDREDDGVNDLEGHDSDDNRDQSDSDNELDQLEELNPED